MTRTWLVVGSAAVLWACDLVKVDSNLPYLKEADGGCAVEGQQPWRDGFCHLGPEGGAGGGAGGGTGGAVGGGTGGAIDAGGTDAGSVDAGPVDAGPVDAGPADAGCQPTTCAANGWNCGMVDAGCGVQLNCGACDPARFEACGVGGVPNVCAPAEICSDDGWCWQNPLPQGNTLRAVWVNGPNDVWTGGDHGTLLHWDGEKWSRLAIPAPNEDVIGLASFGSELWVAVPHRVLRHSSSGWTQELSTPLTFQAFSAISRTGMFVTDGTNLYQHVAAGGWSAGMPIHASVGYSTVTMMSATGDTSTFLVNFNGIYRYDNGIVQGPEFATTVTGVSSSGDGGASFLLGGNVIYRRNPNGVWTSQLFDLPHGGGDGGDVKLGWAPWNVTALLALSNTDAWAFGERGAQAHFDGVQIGPSHAASPSVGRLAGVDA